MASVLCKFANNTGSQFIRLSSLMSWQGSGDPAKTIVSQKSEEFKFFDITGTGTSAAISYLTFDEKYMWIVAWSTTTANPNQMNKVYTVILDAKEPFDWAKIKDRVNVSGNKSSDHNKWGFSADAYIDPGLPTPTITATFGPASAI